MTDTLLKTKLYIPPSRPTLVSRPRLLERLNDGLHRKFSLISAPPGFGKTTLLSEWIAGFEQNGGEPTYKFAWVSLDEYDNDPARFWSYVFAALDSVQPNISSDAKTLLLSPQAPPPIETTLTTLINDLLTISDKLVLVLDDYHIINGDVIHQALSFLLDNLPPQMHIAMTSRTDPPLPLTSLRVKNQLTELRDSDLRFTTDEAVAFLNTVMGLDLSTGDIAALESRTEGWVAGLQLAALSMQGHRDTLNFVREFTGSHRYVIDYLAEEVLNRQPQHIRNFLLYTSILDRMSGPLCDTILAEVQADTTNGQPVADMRPSQSILEHLEQTNLFLIPLDGERRWYRYHHLFADFLREHLRQEVGEAGMVKLHHRASAWFAEHNYTSEAIQHAFLANDINIAVQLVEQTIIDLLISGEVNTVMGWLEAFPEGVIDNRPRLMLGQAWAMIILNRWSMVESLVNNAEQRLLATEPVNDAEEMTIQGMQGEIAALRAMMIGDSGDIERAMQLCEQALVQLPKDNQIVRSIITMTLGSIYGTANQWEKASRTMAEALHISRSIDAVTVALPTYGNLGRIKEEMGQLHQAADYYREAIQYIEQRAIDQGHSGKPILVGSWSYLSLAEILREWNQLDEAERYATIGINMSQQLHGTSVNETIGFIILSRIHQAKGNASEAIQSIQQAIQSVDKASPLHLWVGAIQARLWLMGGNIAAAGQWAQRCDLPIDETNFAFEQYPGEYTTLARLMIAQEQFDDAVALLQRMHNVAQETGRTGRLVEVVMLQALAEYAQGNEEAALPLLTEAVQLGAPGGYIRLFVDEGPTMAQLLRQVKPCLTNPQHQMYVATLLKTFSQHSQPVAMSSSISKPRSSSILIEPLSERELEVLGLVANGLSNREIAEQLYITVGTAKTHTINIYRKLDVRSRTQAVARATELGLLGQQSQ